MDKAIYLLYSSYVSSERRRPKAKQTLLLLLFLLLLSLVPLSAHFHLNDPEKEGFFCHTRHERSPRDLSFPSSYLGPFSFRLNPFDAICTYISPRKKRGTSDSPRQNRVGCLSAKSTFFARTDWKNLISPPPMKTLVAKNTFADFYYLQVIFFHSWNFVSWLWPPRVVWYFWERQKSWDCYLAHPWLKTWVHKQECPRKTKPRN